MIAHPGPISWQRNLYALTIASFLMFTALGFVFPFMPLFIDELGAGDLHQVEVWSGVTAFAQSLTLALFSPIWGAIADRRGRRLMVLRVAFAGGLIIGLTGLSQNVYQFLALRTIQGALTGVIAATTALASSFVPRERLGYALGMLQMSLFSGSAIGPLVGGVVADRVGYRTSFAVCATLMLAAGLTTLLFVREEFVPAADEPGRGLRGFFGDIGALGADRQLITMMLVLFSVHFGIHVVLPMLPLFVATISNSASPATMTGIAFTTAGVVGAGSSVLLGRAGDRFGHRRVLIAMALGAGLFYIPQAFVTNVMQFIVLRGVLGFFDGGLLPAANALVAAGMPGGRLSRTHGTTYGLVYLATSLGFGAGPLAGGFIAASLGLRNVFLVTAFILIAVGLYLPFGVKEPRPALAATARAEH